MSAAHESPVHIVSTGAKGEPALALSTISTYLWEYSDKGSGATKDVTGYTPFPIYAYTGYWEIGDYAQGNYSAPTGTSWIVRALNDNPASPLIKKPDAFTEVWNDKGSGGDNDGSVWFAVPPSGYVSIGYVFQPGYDNPAGGHSRYGCLRKDLVETTGVGAEIWNDRKSGAKMDVALYAITGVPCAFVAQPDYNGWNGTAYRIKGL